ncbi:MAG: hypothetical protein QOI48_1871 [Solirubrobacteraceae bacterium]|nr:hypothetical protein [Solirubrobacteraceae bacterium]
MNAIDTHGQPSVPIGSYTKWFRRAMWVDIIHDWALGIPAIFAPERVLRLTEQRPDLERMNTGMGS